MEVMTNLALAPATELLSHVVADMLETSHKAKEVIFQKENFRTFSAYLEKTAKILREFSNQNLDRAGESSALRAALEALRGETKASKSLVAECRARNKLYLLLNSRKIIKRVEDNTKAIGAALARIPLASLGVSLSAKSRVDEISEEMSRAEYRAEEEILEKIAAVVREPNRGRSHANALLAQIAEALGLSTEPVALKLEYESLKREAEEAKKNNDEESPQMDQIISLLGKADAATSSEEKEKKYLERRNSLGGQRLAPLQGFFCRLTQEVMVDPVETSSGQTFERSAIEKWMAEGNGLCPLTSTPLDAAALRPNRTLRNSIEEWRSRNAIIAVAAVRAKLRSEDEEEVAEALARLRELCAESESCREWAAMEDYNPILVELLRGKSREIRNDALVILSLLAKHTEGNREKIVNVDRALESIVRSLARKHEESVSALRLLLELSRSNAVRDSMGSVHGCILLLVTMLSSEDDEVARDAQELIETLSFHEENVKQMAKANYFKPLLKLLSSGSEEVRMRMAETLADIELTDHSKLSLVQDGALRPLIQMLSDGDLEKKKVALKCLMQISNLPQNGLKMLEEGAIRPLFETLYHHSLQLPAICEQVAATIMNLCSATTNQEPSENLQVLVSEDDVLKFFSLISLTGPETKQSILSAFSSLCESPSGLDIRAKLRQISALRLLVQLCEDENNVVRANAVKLFYCLTKDGDDATFLEHVNQKCVENLLNITETSNDADEISASLGIIANLPKVAHMTQWLVDADALRVIRARLPNGRRDSRAEENAAAALCRFTVSTNPEWQTRVAEAGMIPILVQFLSQGSTCLAKRNAAVALKQLSESSKRLSKPVKKPGGLFACCAAAPEGGCAAHSGLCGVESSFCLLKAEAVEPLVRVLEEADLAACEASLDALLTLVDAERPQEGSWVLDRAGAVAAVVKLLSSSSVELQRKCLGALGMVFQVEELKRRYGGSAQMPLVDITQMKSSDLKEIKSMAAKLLSQLGVLGLQSSFF